MAEFFEMPQASPTMEAGRILEWKKAEGDVLEPMDVLAEVETDKAAMEIEVFDKGVLLKILAEADAEVPAGRPIAIIGTSADEDISDLLKRFEAMGDEAPAPSPAVETAAPAPSPEAAPAPAAAAPTRAGVTPFSWQGNALPDAIMEMPEAFAFGDVGESDADVGAGVDAVRAAPAARKAAREAGVDLRGVTGTGPRGRIMRSDVEQAAQAPAAAAGPAAPADETVRNSMMRKTIARRLGQVWQEAPSFFLTARLDCDRLVPFRAQLKQAGLKVSYNDLVIKACARALRDVPEVNATWGADAITRFGSVDVGIAVALDGGLITPVIRQADTKGLAAIGEEARELAGRARDGKLKADEYQGATFTISNLGMMDIEHFTAILNPPGACILAVGGMQQEPVVVGGELSVGWRMRVTLTCDHRVVDGALGARFLQAVRRYIENPALLAA
jgi:pyruvate dehydrogenase E2 component (dihydrolipoamide acetyltransferase)